MISRLRLPAVVLLLAVCTGCGVRESAVIPGASGPTVSTSGTQLYLVRNGKLTMVLRPPGSGDITTTLALLANGASPDETAHGFTSEVPRSVAPIGVTTGPEGLTTVSLAIAPTALSAMAVNQIACTARTAVRLVGGGVTTGLVACPA